VGRSGGCDEPATEPARISAKLPREGEQDCQCERAKETAPHDAGLDVQTRRRRCRGW
jgi:hypothetical protein